ncbi:FAD-dependent oxidoreductase [Cyanobacterium sp. uoEpiScrs1]|uniref:FAD-dependent oxidoreductase n=1 Tax=Cyanobacterium sp. uoEpiScrs1 TaxID=2976343 RepID=UPI003A5CC61F
MHQIYRYLVTLPVSFILWQINIFSTLANSPSTPNKIVECEILIVGGGLAGTAAAYEGLLAGKNICLTEITDWVGGQISSQGTSALDERPTQRSQLIYPRGYLELRKRIKKHYGKLNPGNCWVSESCFLPRDGDLILMKMLKDAAKKHNGTLRWFPSTVIKEINIGKKNREVTGEQILSVIAIQHQSADGQPPLNTDPLSQTIEDAYTYKNSSRFDKTIIHFIPDKKNQLGPTDWYVIEGTETGEIIGLTGVPHRLGIDPRSSFEPSSSSIIGDPYCTQGFTFTFAIETTKEPQTHEMPIFYSQYAPYYSYELERLANFDLVYTYRRIWNQEKGKPKKFGGINFTVPTAGDISMQNWTWGNDYRPGNSQDNLIYTRRQLQETGQLKPGGWMGGLRTESLRKGEENALGYFYWLMRGMTDSQLGEGVKKINVNHRFLLGLNSPMGTKHGLSKYPYIREARRIIGRKSSAYKNGFLITEIDISRRNYQDEFYKKHLTSDIYRRLHATIRRWEGFDILNKRITPGDVTRRKRSTLYPDSVGIGHYAIDFHPCMTEFPVEKPDNIERKGERQGAGQAYPFQVPLRAMIPQKIDNLLITGKSIAVSHIAAAAYRVHSFEWSSGAAAGTVAAFALNQQTLPYQMVKEPIFRSKMLKKLQKKLNKNGNFTNFPDTSIFNNDWDHWK